MRLWISTRRPAGAHGLLAMFAPLAMGVSCPASAQTRPVDPQAAREATDAAAVPLSESEVEADSRARPLAAGRNDTRTPSRNEAYNRARAAEGRLGVRLGNDVGFRISDR